ncbi:MAG: DUF1858 domain-containing protein [Lachnospiraceae bacterium]|nr:DUF1858 domain-containing protein [Lachnospiraceae bacterium]
MSDIKEFINKDMIISDVIREYPDAIYALMDCGMGCVGCPASQGESVQEAAMVHGLNPDEVIDYVNHVLTEKEANA